MNSRIDIVIDEITFIIDSLKNGHAFAAYAAYLDWAGDVKQLNGRDYSAACELLWSGIEDAGFELESETQLRAHAGFQLAW